MKWMPSYGEVCYNVDLNEVSDDPVYNIKQDLALLANSWYEIAQEAEKEDNFIKIDYVMRALEKLENASFLIVKSNYV